MHHIVDRDTFWELMCNSRAIRSAEDTLRIAEHTYHCANPPDMEYISNKFRETKRMLGLPPETYL